MYWSATETADAGPLLKPSSLRVFHTLSLLCLCGQLSSQVLQLFPFQISLFLSGMSGELMMTILSPQRARMATAFPRHSPFLAGSTGHPCPQAPVASPCSRQQSGESPLPSEPLASSPSTWEFPDSSLLAKGGVQTFPQSICVLACPLLPVQERQQLSPPWGSQADTSPWAGREHLMLELHCHASCPCHPPPILPPRWGSF